MPGTWTSDRIVALAPDPASAKAGRELANPRKWVTLGQNDDVIWGECQGSGAKPYQTQIDPSEPAFKCSCPSRKFPCKHALALFLLTEAQPKSFKTDGPPPWVAEWLQTRAARAEKKARKEETAAAPDPVAQAKRAAERVAKVNAGLIELERWLHDLVRQGFASLQQRPSSYWENAAARLIDAQARGAARLVRDLASIPASGEGWPDRLLEQLGSLHLLLEAYKRIDALDAPLAADVRALIGWPQDKDSLRDAPAQSDHWLVLGQVVEEDDDRIRVQRNWLWACSANRPALVLNFAHASQPLDTSIVPGIVLEADLSFFPSAYPLRAIVKDRKGTAALDEAVGFNSIDAALNSYADALAAQPWLEWFPMNLRNVIPAKKAGQWIVRDQAGAALELSPRFQLAWELLSISGGQPINLFSESDGRSLLPLSVMKEQHFHPLSIGVA